MTTLTGLAEVPVPTRGSGAVTCCGGHRDRCLFGRCHTWATWYENGLLVRTRTTFHCLDCGGTCTADEAEYLKALRGLAGELASFTAYPPEPNLRDGTCGACGYTVDAGEGLIALGSDEQSTFAVALHTWCAEDIRGAAK